MSADRTRRARISWFDGLKGISILWIAVFHFFIVYDAGRYPWLLNLASFPAFMEQCAPSSFPATVGCVVDGLLATVFERGAQAVAVFIVASGFGLTYSLVGKGGPNGGWKQWYRKRLLRLFPLYWLAHLIYLVAPFISRKDAIDYRFLLSFLGDRFYPPDTLFYYLVPAWWYFGLIIQLYLVFPLLFRLLQKLGPVRFLALCISATIVTRYLLVDVFHANGNYPQGAFFMGRLWEFAMGMVLAYWYHRQPERVEKHLFAGRTFLAGIAIYIIGTYSYRPVFFHALTDGLIGLGLTLIIAQCAHRIDRLPILRSPLDKVGEYSYGLYLLHQPFLLYVGQRLHDDPMPYFLLYAFLVLGTIFILSMFLEKNINTLISNHFDRLGTNRS